MKAPSTFLFKVLCLFVCVLTFTITFRFCIWPFCRVSWMESIYEESPMSENLFRIEDQILKYSELTDIVCGTQYEGATNTKQRVNMKLNWNHTITVTTKDTIFQFVPETASIIGVSMATSDKGLCDDSICSGIEFTNKKHEIIQLLHQDSPPTLGRRLYGFYIYIGDVEISTGNKTFFDY